MRCGACRGEHATVAEVRACHGAPAARPAPVAAAAPPPAPEPAPVPVGDPAAAALAILAAAGLAVEVLLDSRNDRRGWARRR